MPSLLPDVDLADCREFKLEQPLVKLSQEVLGDHNVDMLVRHRVNDHPNLQLYLRQVLQVRPPPGTIDVGQ